MPMLAEADLSQTLINPDSLQVFYIDLDDLGNPFLADTFSFLRQEPLGYIGDDYTRFRIHFCQVAKISDYQYSIEGYCHWWGLENTIAIQGVLTVDSFLVNKSAEPYDRLLFRTRYGIVYATVELSNTHGDGRWTGSARFNYKLMGGKFCYDTEGIACADGYENNQYSGIWESGGKKLVCNWGDYRIPGAENDFDVGAAYFSPQGGIGWESYRIVLEDSLLWWRDRNWWQDETFHWDRVDWQYEHRIEEAYWQIQRGTELSSEQCMSLLPASHQQFLQYWDWQSHQAFNGDTLVSHRYLVVNGVMKRQMLNGDNRLIESYVASMDKWVGGWSGEALWITYHWLWKKYPSLLEKLLDEDELRFVKEMEQWEKDDK